LTRRRDDGLVCATDLFEFPVGPDDGDAVGPAEQAVTVGLRPEAIALDGSANGVTASLRLPARVLLREDLGGEEIVYLDVRGTPLTTVLRHGADAGAIPDETSISLDPRDLVVFDANGARLGRGLAANRV
jgi:ABC-type sugar transport system ATPase subunit